MSKEMKTNKLLTVLAVLSIASVIIIAGCKKDKTDPSTISPTVISTDASNNAVDVVLNKVVTATFSVPMNQATLTASTFTVTIGETPVEGVVSYTGSTASFTPSANLLSGVTYTGTITTGAKNVAGSALAADYVWTFKTLTIPNVIVVPVSYTHLTLPDE